MMADILIHILINIIIHMMDILINMMDMMDMMIISTM